MSAPVRASRPARIRPTVHARPVLAPTPYGLDDLLALTRTVAGEVRAGGRGVAVDPGRRRYRLPRGDGLCDVWLIGWATGQIAAGFPLGHVHDVSNVERAPAVSVHAYSPPRSAMSSYDVEDVPGSVGVRRLRRVRSELVEPGRGVG